MSLGTDCKSAPSGLSVNIQAISLYYADNLNSMTPDTFGGQRTAGSLSLDAGLSIGATGSLSTYNGFNVYGVGSTFGFGGSPTIISGGINTGQTDVD